MGAFWGREGTTSSDTTHQGLNLTVAHLNEQLHDLVDWELFAIHLEGIFQFDINLIRHDYHNLIAQRTALYDCWLRRCPNPSWDHVITALKKAREFTLAQQIREHVVKHEGISEHHQSQPQPQSQTQHQSSQVTVDEDTVKELTGLRDTFNKIFLNFYDELSNLFQAKKVTLNSLLAQLEIEKATYDFHDINNIKGIDKFFSVIQPHSTFIDCHLPLALAERFLDLNSKVLEALRKHNENIKALKQNVKLENLRNILHKFIAEASANETFIIVKAQKAWYKKELHAVEVLLKTLFPFQHQKKLFRVEPGSMKITYLVPHHITESFITHTQHKKEFMRLTGIISLQIGEIFVVQASEENEQFTFEMGLMEAVETGNKEAVKFLLKHVHADINGQAQSDSEELETVKTEVEIEQTPEPTEDQLTTTDL